MLWLIIVLVVLAVLVVGGIIARNRQLASTRPAFERALAQVDHDLAAAAANDRGWDRSVLEAAARQLVAERFGTEPEELTLVEVIDKPGTDQDQAVFTARVGGQPERVVLGRREGDWIAA
ncbi:hypothetical protein DVA67_020190 [Solirubrobacter sp. CPCC 204708]|uniref:DUF4878 domain-containing protein n=1 Tax=Solirubrobacter deserti TaxID=2282478 RepID=A0ABT4RTK9_9ACTN|nr:hypothetical protein [Solirubrobacter deserti]MBE2318313.1 hypothetical protein [Solirubrobacter deserti]MDA0141912.1 hypothetical protein [Solirubrobacter deserti]